MNKVTTQEKLHAYAVTRRAYQMKQDIESWIPKTESDKEKKITLLGAYYYLLTGRKPTKKFFEDMKE